MERRDYDYYEANVADVDLADITSSEDNAEIINWSVPAVLCVL